MKQIQEAFYQLLQAIKESDEYIRYHKIRKKLKEFPDLERQMNEFRRTNYDLQKNREKDLYWETEQVDARYSELRKNPYVQEYLSSELALCRMYQEINWQLIENMDIDVEFLEND